jgi:hypothetical protein
MTPIAAKRVHARLDIVEEAAMAASVVTGWSLR